MPQDLETIQQLGGLVDEYHLGTLRAQLQLQLSNPFGGLKVDAVLGGNGHQTDRSLSTDQALRRYRYEAACVIDVPHVDR